MPTNYDVSGTDLEDIFQIYYSQQASATGLTVKNSDLNTYFEKIGGGTTASTTNYTVRFTTTVSGIGTVYEDCDLNTIFAGKTYSVDDSSTYAEVVNTDSTKYIVLCFGSKTSNTDSILSNITFNKATTVNYWIVGGGGGGGGASNSTSTGGAGGGSGGSITTGSFSATVNTNYYIYIGKGGSGGIAIGTGEDGDNSYIIKQSNYKTTNYIGYAAGGKGGEAGTDTYNLYSGSGGAASTYNDTTNIGKGGNGADTSGVATDGNDGKNMTSLVSITLSNYGPRFSGGGGGGGTSGTVASGKRNGGTGGGSGIGGDGGTYDGTEKGGDGTMMTGSGGGGAAKSATTSASRAGGEGGSGVVILWFTYY